MSFLHWPRQARLWESFASTLEAGLPPDRALALAAEVAGGEPGRRARLAALRVTGGTPVSEALASAGEDAFACAIVRAGERTGRLPPLARQLAAAYQVRAALRNEALSRLAYPALLIHLALAAVALPMVVAGTAPAWALLIGPAALWLLIAGAVVAAWWSKRSGLLARLALRAPLSALCWPALAADLTAVLRAAVGAGLLGPDALMLAADACANRELSRHLAAAARSLREGSLADLSAALAASGLPRDLLELVRSGEASGKLEEGLGQARAVAAERFAWRLQWTARAINGLIFALAALVVALTVISMVRQIYAPLVHELESGG